MKYLSVCSGIEAATVAWSPLGWEPVGFSEIEPFPCAVLAHHYPTVPNFGDMTNWKNWNLKNGTPDLICGGTPCQDYSIAGNRAGMAGDRGSLSLTFIQIAARYRPRWIVWENVPGVLSSNKGRDFAKFLGDFSGTRIEVPKNGWKNSGIIEGIADAYGIAYRVLDAQYIRVDGFGRAIPQRRRRVFVVGHLGDWRRAAAVLFERQSLCGNSPPSRKAGEGVASDVGKCLKAKGNDDHRADSGNYVVAKCYENHAQDSRIKEIEIAECLTGRAGTGGGNLPLVQCAPTLVSNGDAHSGFRDERGLVVDVVAMRESGQGYWMKDEIAGTLRAEGENRPSRPSHVIGQPFRCGMLVRRLTPIECERLMGFPDNYTRIPWKGKPAEECPDGHRYKALGNSWAINCARWIGRRIEMVEKLNGETK